MSNLPVVREEQAVAAPITIDLRGTLLTQLADPATPIEIRKQILDMMERLGRPPSEDAIQPGAG